MPSLIMKRILQLKTCIPVFETFNFSILIFTELYVVIIICGIIITHQCDA